MAKPYRNRKMLDAAKDVPCIRCGKEGETRACHYNGVCQDVFGKGRGQKCDDLMTAEFCHLCDQRFTEGKLEPWYAEQKEELADIHARNNAKWLRSQEFLYFISLTNIRRIERGILK